MIAIFEPEYKYKGETLVAISIVKKYLGDWNANVLFKAGRYNKYELATTIQSNGFYNLFNIRVSSYFQYDKQALMNALLHELLHTMPDSFSHKGTWRQHANMINKYTIYDIQRCTLLSDFAVDKIVEREAKL